MKTLGPLQGVADVSIVLQRELPLLVFEFDTNDRLAGTNKAFRDCFCVDVGAQPTWSELMLKCYQEQVGALIQTANFAEWLASARSRRGKAPYRAFEAGLCDGRWMWMTETVYPDGSMVCVGADITALRSSGRELRRSRDRALRASQIDALTGISNRAHIMKQLEARIIQLQTHHNPCGVALLDLDHFKSINDTYGHFAGDQVLKCFTQSIQSSLRREDGFGRMGGEEFLLIFPGIDAAGSAQIVARLLKSIRCLNVIVDHHEMRITCSGGLASLQPSDTAASLYRRADKAMYAAKIAGRDQWKWAETTPSHTECHSM